VSSVAQVPLLDLRRNPPELDDALRAAFDRVLKSGTYILGPEVEGLEKECAQYIGVKHAIGVSSGTDALLLALMSLGVGPGDEVICPTYTFFASAGSIWRTGAKPVFVDIEERCFNLDPKDVKRKITSKTKVIMPVHLFGQSAEMDSLLTEAAAKGLRIVEDGAQAIGSKYRGRSVGAMGDFGCFSFFPSKNLGAFGDAGLVTTNDDALAEKARILRAHGSKPKYYHHVVGANFRIDALQAALLRVKLKHLDGWTQRRQANAALYTRLFMESGLVAPALGEGTCASGCAAVPKVTPLTGPAKLFVPVSCQERHIYNQYVVRVAGEGMRDRLQAFLKERRIGSEVYYPVPMHMQKCFVNLNCREGDFPVSERAAKTSLALPIFPELTEEEIRYVVESVVQFLHA
jgi:dTDP-4-amino-4,6-dideoxygalactose transaminase